MELDFDAVHWELVGSELRPLSTPKEINYPSEPNVVDGVVYGFDDQYTGSYTTGVQCDGIGNLFWVTGARSPKP